MQGSRSFGRIRIRLFSKVGSGSNYFLAHVTSNLSYLICLSIWLSISRVVTNWIHLLRKDLFLFMRAQYVLLIKVPWQAETVLVRALYTSVCLCFVTSSRVVELFYMPHPECTINSIVYVHPAHSASHSSTHPWHECPHPYHGAKDPDPSRWRH